MRDPASLNKPSTRPIGEAYALGSIPGMDVHWGLVYGVVGCIAAYVLMRRTTFGFAAKMIGGNVRAALLSGLAVHRIIVVTCFLAGAAAGLAGMAEVAAVHGTANASLIVGYGYTGILVAFTGTSSTRSAFIPVAVLVGGIGASEGPLAAQRSPARRRRERPARHSLRRHSRERDGPRPHSISSCPSRGTFLVDAQAHARGRMTETGLGLWGLPIALLGGALRVSTPYLFVSLGECLTEKSGRINLGQEGTLIMGAMGGYGVSYLTGSPWLGVLAAGGRRRGCSAPFTLGCAHCRASTTSPWASRSCFSGLVSRSFSESPSFNPRPRTCRRSSSEAGALWRRCGRRSRSTSS